MIDKHGQIDGVANCIGTVELTKPPHITSEAEFRTTMDNNVLTAFNTLKGAVRPIKCQMSRNALVHSALYMRFQRPRLYRAD